MALARTAYPTLASLRGIRSEIIAVAKHRGATNVRVFGSVARGDGTPTSDVDILVDLEPGRSLFDLGGLQMDL
ncbi:MAG: nucleotidyltransferase domain-containing protein, partial [Microthrixaceae bacterium]|nr:nucleotidyltransferase domain-containing protein [Microthrixaceae bacterium]